MREVSEFFRIYCNIHHKQWPELVGQIEQWLNTNVSEATGYAPIELMFGEEQPDVFKRLLLRPPGPVENRESMEDKNRKAFEKILRCAQGRARRRKRRARRWDPKVSDLVLVKTHHQSDAARGQNHKFHRPHELPWIPADIALLSSNFAQIANVYVIGLYDWIGIFLICLAVFSIIVQVCDM
jgi:hypothetical protein